MQIIELEMSKALSDSFFNPQASSLFRTNGSDLLNAEQLVGHLGVKVGWVKRQSRIKTLRGTAACMRAAEEEARP